MQHTCKGMSGVCVCERDVRMRMHVREIVCVHECRIHVYTRMESVCEREISENERVYVRMHAAYI